MANYAKLTLVGNLGKDSETKFFGEGVDVTEFSVPKSSGYYNKEKAWVEQPTTWFNIKAFKLSEKVREGLNKGALVMVTCEPKTEKWNDKTTGEEKSKIVWMADKVILLDKKVAQQEQQTPVAQEVPDELPF